MKNASKHIERAIIFGLLAWGFHQHDSLEEEVKTQSDKTTAVALQKYVASDDVEKLKEITKYHVDVLDILNAQSINYNRRIESIEDKVFGSNLKVKNDEN